MKRTHILASLLFTVILLSIFALTSLANDETVSDKTFTPGCSEAEYYIPDAYKDAKFIVFREDKTVFTTKDTLNAALEQAKSLVSLVSNSHMTVTVLVREHVTQTAHLSNMGQTLGSIVIDLNGYTISQSSVAIFNAQSKLKDNSYDNAYFLVKNGEIILNDQGLFRIGAYGSSYDTNYNSYKDMDFEFKNIKISLAEGATLKSFLGFFGDDQSIGQTKDKSGYDTSSANGTLSTDFPIAHSQYSGLNVTFGDDCVIDISGAPDGFTLFNANDTAASNTKHTSTSYYWFDTKSVVCVKIFGGKIISNCSDINWYDINYSLGSNVMFLENENGGYTEITIKNGKTLDENFTLPTISGELAILDSRNTSDTTTYTLSTRKEENSAPGCSEKYYSIPEANKDAEIILFKSSGTVYKTYTSLNTALNDAKALTNTASNRNSTVTVLLRKNVEQSAYFENMGQGIGNIIIDLNGYTLSQTNGIAIFNAEAKYTAYQDDYYVTVKNGNIILNDAGLLRIGIYGATYDSDETHYKIENYEFKNVNISLAENSTLTSVTGTFTDNNTVGRVPKTETDPTKLTCAHSQRMGLNVIFREDVTIDIRGALPLTKVFDAFDTDIGEDARNTTVNGVANYYYTANSIVSIRVIGGKIIADSDNLVWYKENRDNNSSVIFESDKNGNYTEFLFPKDIVLENTQEFNPRDNNLVRVKKSETNESSAYILYPYEMITNIPFSLKTSVVLDSELIYNLYVSKSENLISFSADDKEYTDFDKLDTVEIDGKNYYLIQISLPAATAAREIKFSAKLVNAGLILNKRFSLSLSKYASQVYASHYSTDNERVLVGDILSYVKAAYEYFPDSNMDDVKRIDAVLDKDHNLMSCVDKSSEIPSVTGLKYATFVLDGAPKVRFYVPDDKNASDYSFNIGEKTYTATYGSDEYGKYADISVYAYNLSETFDCLLDGKHIGSYNINSYYDYTINNEETDNNRTLITLVERLWKYSQSAKAYRSEVLGDATAAHEHYFIKRSFDMTTTNPKYDERVCACGYSEKTMYTGIDDGTKAIKVLFIGNSSTFYNDMPDMFFYIAKSSGINLTVTSVTRGGWGLDGFMDPTDKGGALVDKAFAENDFDYVILQDYTTRATLDREKFYTGVRGVGALAEADGAKVLLYHPISRPDNHSLYKESGAAYGYNTDSFTRSNAAAYEAIGEEMGYTVSRAGAAFLDLYKNYSDKITIYAPDNEHPSPETSYAFALCHFATLFGRSPIGIEYTAGFDAETALILQTAAYNAVYGESIVTEEYKTSSVGIGNYPAN